jgi:predicted RNase H-like HicB family nuclease
MSLTLPLELKPTVEQEQMSENTYSILIEDIENNRVLGTCQELENVFIDGKDTEDILRRIRIVIEEKLSFQKHPNQKFNLRLLLTL